jgi:proteasome lid subunit RPN8/RPN11
MSDDVVDRLLVGAVDLHSHPFPSPFPRRIDILEAARSYAEAGFAGMVAKSHHHSTAPDVLLLKRHGLDETGVRVFGAVAMNAHVGGLNPHAVNLALAQGARVVWFPTISSPQHIEHSKHHQLKFPKLAIPLIEDAPVDVWDGEELLPRVHEILRMIADADAVLAAGHMDPRSILAVLEAARDAGVRRMVVNHPNFVIEASLEDARRMADLGAVIEHSLCMYDERSTFFQEWSIDVLVEWVREIGVDRTILGSDLGQQNNPLPVESYRLICGRLLEAGLTEAEVRTLVVDNPGRVLGGA